MWVLLKNIHLIYSILYELQKFEAKVILKSIQILFLIFR